MKDFITEEMAEKEIAEGLKLFKKCLLNWGYDGANPMQQNCYISSSDIIGVYFPNSFIKAKDIHTSYIVASVSKVGGVLGVVFSLEDGNQFANILPPYYFEDFNRLLYTPEYREIKAKQEQKIKGYNERIDMMQRITRVYKKDGKDFADILKNFKGVSLSFERSIYGAISGVRVGGRYTLYRDYEKTKNNEEITVKEIKELIAKDIQQYCFLVEQTKKELSQMERIYSKYEKIAQQLADLRKITGISSDYEKELFGIVLDYEKGRR